MLANVKSRKLLIYLFLYVCLFQIDFENLLSLTREQEIWLGLGKYTLSAFVGCLLFFDELRKDMNSLLSYKKLFCLQILGYIFLYVFLNILSGLVVTGLLELLKSGNTNLQNDIRIMETAKQVPPYIFLIFVGFIGPFVEELVFRKSLLNLLRDRLSPKIAILCQTLLFALVHVHLLSLLEFIQVIPHFIIGIYWGYLYYKTQNIYYSMTVHMVTNTLALYLTFFT